VLSPGREITGQAKTGTCERGLLNLLMVVKKVSTNTRKEIRQSYF
jgi:hypothetical protein